MLEVFRVQRDFLLASTGHQDPNIPLTGTGPEQALKIREIKEMATAQRDGRFDFYSKVNGKWLFQCFYVATATVFS